MTKNKSIVIFGGSSCIASDVAKIWIQESNVDLILVGRNIKKLHSVSSELLSINPLSKIICKELVFENIEIGQKLINQIFSTTIVSKVLIAFGTLPLQSQCEKDFFYLKEAMFINGILPILYSEMILSIINKDHYSTLAIIGSVAGDRGRKSNYFYGSAKNMISTYVQGARHRFCKTKVNVCVIKPGPTLTPMTETLEMRFKLSNSKTVAQDIVKGIKKKQSVIYTPKKWRLIMFAIRNLPEFIYHKLEI